MTKTRPTAWLLQSLDSFRILFSSVPGAVSVTRFLSGVRAINLHLYHFPCRQIRFGIQIKFQRSSFACILPHLRRLNRILHDQISVCTVKVKGVAKVVVERSSSRKVPCQANELTIGNRIQMAKLFQYTEFLGKVGISPATGIVVVDLSL